MRQVALFTYCLTVKSEQYFGRGGTIRIVSASDWFTTFLFPMIPGLGPRQLNETDGGTPGKILHFTLY